MGSHVARRDVDDFLGRQTEVGLPLADDQERVGCDPVPRNDTLRVKAEGVGQSADQIPVRLNPLGCRTRPAVGLASRAPVRRLRDGSIDGS